MLLGTWGMMRFQNSHDNLQRNSCNYEENFSKVIPKTANVKSMYIATDSIRQTEDYVLCKIVVDGHWSDNVCFTYM